jgi:Coenzyme PQQ synthesis protein D (PqqD)
MDSQSLKVESNVLATEFEGGEGILVDLNSKQYFQLNGTALFIWKRLEEAQPFDSIVQELAREYELTNEQVASSVERFLNDLSSYNLVR